MCAPMELEEVAAPQRFQLQSCTRTVVTVVGTEPIAHLARFYFCRVLRKRGSISVETRASAVGATRTAHESSRVIIGCSPSF
jgi:hypothetical protein